MAKKLKKKHQPMRFLEWMDTTGFAVLAVDLHESDDPGLANLRELAESHIMTDEGRATMDRVYGAYHAYVCAHILNLLEKP